MAAAPSLGCIFCRCARGPTSTTLLHADDKVVAFQDIKPSAFRPLFFFLWYGVIFWANFGKLFRGLRCLNLPRGFTRCCFLICTPSVPKHYLVIPVEHISTVNSLRRRNEDFSMVSHMLEVGQTLLSRDAPHSKYRFGFHQPPFNSVNHLHLHCLALPFIPRWKGMKYSSLGPLGGFIEAEQLLERIKPLPNLPS